MKLTPEDIRAIAEAIQHEGLSYSWWLLVTTIIILGCAAILGAYLAERGKQRALQETAAKLTDAIKRIETFHAANLELFKGDIAIRSARAATTLRAHQEAYALWIKLFDSIWKDEGKLANVTSECRGWWANNCLSLTPKAREEFMRKVNLFWLHREMRGSDSHAEALKRWEEMESLGPILVEGVELPNIDERPMLEVGLQKRLA